MLIRLLARPVSTVLAALRVAMTSWWFAILVCLSFLLWLNATHASTVEEGTQAGAASSADSDDANDETNRCTRGFGCALYERLMDLGEALGVAARGGGRPTGYFVGLAVTLFGALTLVVARIVAVPRPGPITVSGVTQATAAGAGDLERHDLRAILEDRFARVGSQPPSTVPSSVSSSENVPTPTTLSEIPDFVARLVVRLSKMNSRRVGYSVRVVYRRSDRATSQDGMTFKLTSNANGRQLLADTVWASSPQEAARLVAFRVASFVARLETVASTGRVPTWLPDAVSMRAYEDASHFAPTGRLDEAVVACEVGLNRDPSSLPLRYLLGTLHERLGYFLTAVDVYADAISTLLYDGVAFSRRGPAENDSTGEVPLSQPPAAIAGDGPERRGRPLLRRVISDEATQIMWRYVGCLTFADRWLVRWLDDLRRSDGDRPKAPLGFRQTTRDTVEPHENARRRYDRLERAEVEERTDVAKRLRGFFYVRYAALFEEFPLLASSLFGGTRGRAMADAPIDPSKVRQPPPVTELSTALIYGSPWKRTFTVDETREWLVWLFDVAEEWLAIEEQEGGGYASSSSDSGGDGSADPYRLADRSTGWTERLCFWARNPAGVPVRTFEGERDDDKSASGGASQGRFSPPADHYEALSILKSLVAGAPDDDELTARGFSRQRLALLSYRIGSDLLAVSDEHDPRCARFVASRGDAYVEDRLSIAFVVCQLDLRLFFLRASIDEMDLLGAGPWWGSRELWARPFLSPQLTKTVKIGTVHRVLDRVFAILYPSGQQHTSCEISEHRAKIRTLLHTKPTRWDRLAERVRGFVTGEGVWNLWYYEACVLSTSLSQPPEGRAVERQTGAEIEVRVAEAQARHGSNTEVGNAATVTPEDLARAEERRADLVEERNRWMRANDYTARRAVEALTVATTWRPHRGRTAIDAGIGSWMLHQDPDLDRLRSHLRFRRWSAALFEIDQPDQELLQIDDDVDVATGRRFDRIQRLVRLTNETYTYAVLAQPILDVAHHWTAWDGSKSSYDLWSALQTEIDAWSKLVGLPRAITHPRQRAELWRTLNDFTSTDASYPVFPTSALVLRNGRILPVDVTMRVVFASLEEAVGDHRRLQDLLAGSTHTVDVERFALRAGRRWWTLADALENGDWRPSDAY